MIDCGKESLYLVSKNIDYDTASELACDYFGGQSYFNCANFNDCWSRFNYPKYKGYANDNYVFIGNRKITL